MIYLNNAATSLFKPREVYTAFSSFTPAERSTAASLIAASELRSRLLALTNANDHTAILLSGCTHALNQAIIGYALSLSSPCRILITSAEHNAVLRPVYSLERLGFSHTVIPTDRNGTISPKSLEAAITPDVKIAVISHVSNVTGGENDLDALAKLLKSHNIACIADIAQSIGLTDVNLNNVDMAAFPFHKGLHSFTGLGGLIIRNGISLVPLIYGGTGTLSEEKQMPSFPPERYEAGTYNAHAISSALAALKWEEKYRSEIRGNLAYIGQYLLKKLSSFDTINVISAPNSVGIASFTLDFEGFDSTELSTLLAENGIITRGGLHCAPLMHEKLGTLNCGAVRASAGIDTTENDINTLCKLLSFFPLS